MKKFEFGLYALIMLSVLTACGGSSGGGSGGDSEAETDPEPVILEGKLNGVLIEGLSYTSGEVQGSTDADGNFQFEQDGDITFFFGDTVIGTVAGAQVIELIELLAGATPESTEYINLIRYLLILDSDSDLGNGVQISSALQEQQDTLTEVVFLDGDFEVFAQLLTEEVAGVDARDVTLPGVDDAVGVINVTRMCAASGLYSGAYTGSLAGDVWFVIAPEAIFEGVLDSTLGIVLSTDEFLLGFIPSPSLSYSDTLNFSLNLAENTGTFSAVINQAGEMESGVWDFFVINTGTFTAANEAHDPTALYRVSGTFLDTIAFSRGFFSVNIYADNSVSGSYMYGNLLERFLDPDNVELDLTTGSLTGTLADGVISVSDDDIEVDIPFTVSPAVTLVEGSALRREENLGLIGASCRL